MIDLVFKRALVEAERVVESCRGGPMCTPLTPLRCECGGSGARSAHGAALVDNARVAIAHTSRLALSRAESARAHYWGPPGRRPHRSAAMSRSRTPEHARAPGPGTGR